MQTHRSYGQISSLEAVEPDGLAKNRRGLTGNLDVKPDRGARVL